MRYLIFALAAASLSALVAASLAMPAMAADLTAADVKTLLASAGVNRGAVRDIGGRFGLQTLASVAVRPGKGRGRFVVELTVLPANRGGAR